MMRRNKLLALFGSICLGLILAAMPFMAACAPGAPPEEEAPPPPEEEEAPPSKPLVLRYADISGEREVAMAMVYWAEEMEKRTNGRVKVEFYWGGALGRGPEQLDGIKSRVFDLAIVQPAFAPGKTPLLGVFSVPGAIDHRAFAHVIPDTMELPELKAELDEWNAMFLMGAPVPTQELYSNVEIRTIDDFKGKKIRVLGYVGMVLEEVGAVAVSMPPGDIYMGLEKGTIDANAWATTGELPAWGFHEVIDYFITTEALGCVGFLHVMNKDAWNELSPEEQKIALEIAAEVPSKYGAWDQKGIEETMNILHEAGVTFIELSDADKETLRNIGVSKADVWADDMEAKGLPGKKVKDYFFERYYYWEAQY
jgi:TRAP-type C4-dicarboxylate transport system substrate-binding protein